MIQRLLNRLSLTRIILILLVSILPQSIWAEDGNYGLTIAGIPVTSENADDILGDGDGGTGSVSFDQSTNTLTLTNVSLTSTDDFSTDFIVNGINTLTIIILGENAVRCSSFITSDTGGKTAIFTTNTNNCGTLSIESTANNWYNNHTIDYQNGLCVKETGENSDYHSTLYGISIVDYNLIVGGVSVTSANALNITGDNVSGNVSYTPSTNTLTLNGASINGNIVAEEDLIVRFVGENTIQKTTSNMFMFTGNGNNTLTFETDEDTPGKLRIIESTSKDDITHNWKKAPSITEDAADGEDEECDWRVVYDSDENYTDLKLNKKYPIWLNGHQVTDATTFYSGVSYDRETAVLTYGGYYDSYTIKSSLPNLTIVIEGEGQRMQSISFEPSSSVSSGTLTFDIGYNNNVSLSLNDSESDNGVISGFSQVILKSPLQVSTPENFTEWTSSIKTATISSASCYDIKIAGTIVSEVNKSDVFGDGKVSVSVSDDGTGVHTYTLTLNNATITPEQETPGIDYMGSSDLTIRLNGNNIIQGYGGCEAIRYNGVSQTTPNLYFVKDGNQHCSLELIVGEGEDEISGFHTNYDENTFFVYAGDGNGANTHSTIYSTTILGGTGSVGEPHIIASANDLKKFIEYYNDGRLLSNANVRLDENINCSGVTGIVQLADNTDATFRGVFNGNEKTISNLTLTGSGLFGYIKGGTVKDLTLCNYHLTGNDHATGGIVAELSNGATISNCTITNSTIACAENQYNPEVGGIAARMSGSTITGCIIDNVQVKAETTYTGGSGPSANAGGIVASASGGTISSCIVSNGSKITNFYADEGATLKGGAIVGSLYETTLTQNKYDYDVTVEYLNGTNTENKIIKSGYTQRGTGEERVISDVSYYDVFENNGAVLANTKTVTLPSTLGDKGEVEIEEGNYYKKDGDNYQIAVGKNVVVRVGAYEPYTIATFVVPNTSETTFQEIGDGYRDYTFVMPDADVTVAVNFAISISSEDYVATIACVTYNGASQVPASVTLTAQDGEEMVLTNSADSNDFTIKSYKLNNETVTSPIDAGTYTVTIEGMGNYTGTKDAEYIINKANFSNVNIATIAEQTYTGNEIMPAVKVTFNSHPISAEEYDSVYTSNINAGEATITLTSTGKNFVAETQKTKNFTISPKALTEATITLSETEYTYDGNAKNPSVTIKYGSEGADGTSGTTGSVTTLIEGTDYDVSYKKVVGESKEDIAANEIIPAGTYKAIATAKGNYKGIKEATFTITPAASTPTVTITGWTYGQYNAETNAPKVTGYAGDGEITYEYKLQGEPEEKFASTIPENAGNYTLRANIAATENYAAATATTNFTISKANITPTITLEGWTYGATANTPEVNGNTGNGTETITYKAEGAEEFSSEVPSEVGTYIVKVTIAETTNYNGGEATSTFTITNRTIDPAEDIEFREGQSYASFYSADEDLALPEEGIAVFMITGIDGNTLTTQAVTYIPKGVPVLVMKSSGATQAIAPSEVSNNMLHYATSDVTADGTTYILYNGEYVRATGTIPAGKCYLKLNKPSGARALAIGNGTTGIDRLDNTIWATDNWFDLNGRRIEKPTKKGLYIKNGKKVVVK